MRKNPESKIVVIGCYAQLKPTEIAEIEGVDLVLGAYEKFKILDYVDQLGKTPGKGWIQHSSIQTTNSFTEAFSYGDRTRSFLKIQDGCDYNCSFCTIPQARGKSRSNSIDRVLQNVAQISTQGIKEIVLTGVNIGDFGRDGRLHQDQLGSQKATFFDLIQELDQSTSIDRFRISSIEPNLCSDEIIEFVAGSQLFMPHFHMPLQSGNDKQLKMMRRRYTRKFYRQRVELIKRLIPHASIGVDVIVGFPGETEADFQESYAFIRNLDVSYLHVFTYSERTHTPAMSMPGVVPVNQRRRRNQALRFLSTVKKENFVNQHLGSVRPVLLEGNKHADHLTGFTDNYIKVEMDQAVQASVNDLKMITLQAFGTRRRGQRRN